MINFRLPSGMFVTNALLVQNVTLDLKFEPSMGILARRVDKLGADIRSFRVPLKRMIKEVVIPSIRTNFITSGRPAWQPLEQKTIQRKSKKGQSAQPLIASGRLIRKMGQLNIWHIDTEKAMILDLPADVWYGKVHQAGLGSTARTVSVKNISTGKVETFQEADEGGGIPARPFVMVQPEDIDRMEKIMADWVDERVRQAGLA